MTALIVVLFIVAVAALAAAAIALWRYRLRRRFGPEYDRALVEEQGVLRAEAELTSRQRRVRKLDIRPLTDDARSNYAAEWTVIQERFVDAPQSAVMQAYGLVTTMMTERGYPGADDEQAMADLSVNHGETVGHFRAAREITRQFTEDGAYGDTDTETLRQALIHYRALFSDLLGEPAAAGRPAWHRSARYRQPAASRVGTGRHAAESSQQ